MLKDKKILLIISGGIAAYKSLDLIRLVKKNGGHVQCILTNGGSQFVTPLSVSALSENKTYNNLWSLNDEAEMGHIRLSRESDLIIVAPASADIIAKMAHGMANDLATTTILAANKPIMIAPAMNPQMWENPATKANIATLRQRGILISGPENGDMACGETGLGRMSEPEEILAQISNFFNDKPLKGKRAIVTAGPTYEAIDPVRFIGNKSSGKQGVEIAKSLRDAGSQVTLVLGPCAIAPPSGIDVINVTSAKEMLDACESALPADIAIFAAAVSDWRAKSVQNHKIKKEDDNNELSLELTKNPDILRQIANHKISRPEIVVGFAAETQNLENNALKKLKNKGCDFIMANEVGLDDQGNEKAFAADDNEIYFISHDDQENWPKLTKKEIADKLTIRIMERIKR